MQESFRPLLLQAFPHIACKVKRAWFPSFSLSSPPPATPSLNSLLISSAHNCTGTNVCSRRTKLRRPMQKRSPPIFPTTHRLRGHRLPQLKNGAAVGCRPRAGAGEGEQTLFSSPMGDKHNLSAAYDKPRRGGRKEETGEGTLFSDSTPSSREAVFMEMRI